MVTVFKNVIFLTSNSVSPFATPTDWNPNRNFIAGVGGGGFGAGAIGATAGGGGGGGAFAQKNNVSLTRGGTTVFTVAPQQNSNDASNRDTFFGPSATPTMLAKGGTPGRASGGLGGTGGSSAQCVGDVAFSGGNGAVTGGGGAAGPSGVGAPAVTSHGGNADASAAGSGVGGAANTVGTNGSEYVTTAATWPTASSQAGSGGGGGGGTGAGVGHVGGFYGSGAGGGGGSGAGGSVSKGGLIIISWDPLQGHSFSTIIS